MALLSNIHYGLDAPPLAAEVNIVKGNFVYYHYKCDGFNDVVHPLFVGYVQTFLLVYFHRDGVVATEHCKQCARGWSVKTYQVMYHPFHKFKKHLCC